MSRKMKDEECDRVCVRCLTTFICGPRTCPHPGCGGAMITWPEHNAIREQEAAHAARLAALKAAVVAEAMDRHRIETGTCLGPLDESDVLQRYNAACAALAKAEKE